MVAGLEHLPTTGYFVLAVNHFSGRAALDAGAAVMQAVGQARPDALSHTLFIIGQRTRSTSPPPDTPVRRFLNWIYQRWTHNALRIPFGGAEPSLVGLREWRKRQQAMFVFPEGRASIPFRQIRPGAGEWLSRLEMPTIPVAVWWQRDGGWQVRFGAAIEWATRTELRDMQLGLAIAALLPPELAPDWQSTLKRWRALHGVSTPIC
ncbi:MAG: hypothetical protein SF029_00630 [bacterium]|nr:hypothetical protein [bacterium]